MTFMHKTRFLERMADLLGNAKYSDLIIECEGHRFFVHKNIVCTHSPVIERECDSQMTEGLTSIIKHDAFGAETVGHMLSYMYRQSYEIGSGTPVVSTEDRTEVEGSISVIATQTTHGDSNQGPSASKTGAIPPLNCCSSLVAHARVYAIADYYDVPMLKQLALETFRVAAERDIPKESILTVATVLQELDSLGSKELRSILVDCALRAGDKLATTNGVCADQLDNLTGVQEDFIQIANCHMLRLRGSKKKEEELQSKYDDTLAKLRAARIAHRERDNILDNLERIARDMNACECMRSNKLISLNLEQTDRYMGGDGKGYYKITCVTCGKKLAPRSL